MNFEFVLNFKICLIVFFRGFNLRLHRGSADRLDLSLLYFQLSFSECSLTAAFSHDSYFNVSFFSGLHQSHLLATLAENVPLKTDTCCINKHCSRYQNEAK